MALIAPIIFLVMLGSADLGRAFYLNVEVSGASRAGARNGIFSQGTDIGDAVRNEPNSAIPNTVAAWGLTGPGQADGCGPTSVACGDPAGCPPTAFAAGQRACFAVRYCTTINPDGTCGTWSVWNLRPPAFSDYLLDVKVVYQFGLVTPIIANFAPGGVLYLNSDTMTLQQY